MSQQDLFLQTKLEMLEQELADLRASHEAVRKGMFARHDNFRREMKEMKELFFDKKEQQLDFCESKIAHIGA